MEFDLSKRKAALLIIDLQELFTSATGPFKNELAAQTIDEVNKFSQACANRAMPVIFSRYSFRDDLTDAGLLSDNPLVRDGFFSENSKWMKLDQNLQVPPANIQLQRNRPGAFWNGRLDSCLQDLDVDTLLLCGLSVNNAISTTAREAFARDIACVVIKECTGAAPFESDLDAYFETLHTWTAEVASAADILHRLKQ
ncbi:MAG: isochorismatase family protein [Gammaproteobacteria bacterium]|nr:isochorismatase family protein [Gammaproteobacteria bacterium]